MCSFQAHSGAILFIMDHDRTKNEEMSGGINVIFLPFSILFYFAKIHRQLCDYQQKMKKYHMKSDFINIKSVVMSFEKVNLWC